MASCLFFESSPHVGSVLYIEEGIFFEKRKLGGVLVEATGELDMVRYAVVGVGINVFNEVPPNALSLSQILPSPPSLLELSKLLFPRLLRECKPFLGRG